MRAAPCTTLIVAALGLSPSLVLGGPESSRDLSPLLEDARQEQGLPAVIALVIQGDSVVAQGVAGVRKQGRPELAGLDDRWHLGSCTKPITSTMIAVLVERGVLTWETTIAEALPHLAKNIRNDYREVTLEMLLAHRGGIRHEWDVRGLWDILWQREGTPTEQRARMARAMLSEPPKVQPGSYFYSNGGYGIAGHMAETLAGKPWEALMRELVFDPLRMRSAGFGVTWDALIPTDPWPHQRDGTPLTPGPLADNPPSIGPGGTVHVSIGDWAKLIMEHLKGARGEDGRLLKADTMRRLHRSRPTGENDDAYSLGWVVVQRPWANGAGPDDTGLALHHAGSNNSWFALVWIAPERDFAVLCATNIGGDGVFGKVDAVTWAVIQDHLSLPGP